MNKKKRPHFRGLPPCPLEHCELHVLKYFVSSWHYDCTHLPHILGVVNIMRLASSSALQYKLQATSVMTSLHILLRCVPPNLFPSHPILVLMLGLVRTLFEASCWHWPLADSSVASLTSPQHRHLSLCESFELLCLQHGLRAKKVRTPARPASLHLQRPPTCSGGRTARLPPGQWPEDFGRLC